MKLASRNRIASLALAFSSCTVVVSADTITVNLRSAADSRIFNADWGRDNNDGAGGEIGVYQARDRSLLRFDLNSLPPGAALNSANLVLTVSNPYGGNPNAESMNVYRLTQAWTEGGVTWNKYDGAVTWATAGGDYDGTVRASSTANVGTGQVVIWDVSSLAQEWANHTHPNHGLMVINSGFVNGFHFGSKEHGNASYRPYLAANITTPTAPPSRSWTWNGGDGSSGPLDGSGTWTDDDKWWNGATVAAWVDGNDVIFGAGGAAGTVTVFGTVAPQSLWFQSTAAGNYTLTGGNIDLGGAFRVVQTTVNASIASLISNGGLIKQGPGTLKLTGTDPGGNLNTGNTYADGTVISGGTIEIYGKSADNADKTTSLGNGPLTIQSGGTLVTANDWSTGNEWYGNCVGKITIEAGGTMTINTGGNTVRNGLVLNGGTVNGSGANGDWGGMYLRNTSVAADGATPSNISVDTALNTTTVMAVGACSQLNYSGPIHNKYQATGAITKTGDGNLNLSGNNSYTGTTTVQGGLVEITGGTSAVGGMILENGNVTFSGGTTTLSGGITSPSPYASGNLVFGGNSVVTVGGTLQLAALSCPLITIQGNADVTLLNGNQIGNWGNGISLLGGTLRTPSLAASSQGWAYPSRWLHLDGTSVVATASNLDFITMLNWDPTNNVAVGQTHGAIFNTNGNTVGIKVNLVDESGQNGKLTKLGNGTLVLGGQNSYTGDTTVNGGTLQLLKSAGSVSAAITNAGFELPDYFSSGWNYLASDGVSDGWTLTPSDKAGIASNGAPWVTTAPEGDQVGFLQNSSSITQTISVSSAGYYDLSFQTANRPGYSASDLAVQIEATTVGQWTAAQLNSSGAFVVRTVSGIYLSAGTHILTFQATQAGPDSATAIDKVALTSTSFNGRLTFKPGATTVSNKITGSGAGVLQLDGEIFLDLTAAAIANGNSWMLVDHSNLNESYGTNFSVNSSLGAFTNSSGSWSRADGDNTWTFNQNTGVLTLAVTPSDPFLAWINATWPSLSDKTLTGDPDYDSISNLVEYILQGGDPAVSNPAIQPTVDASGSNFIFTFHRRSASTADTTQVFEFSATLDAGSWTPLAIPGGAGVTVTDLGGGIEKVEIIVTKGTNTKLFGRLQATKP